LVLASFAWSSKNSFKASLASARDFSAIVSPAFPTSPSSALFQSAWHYGVNFIGPTVYSFFAKVANPHFVLLASGHDKQQLPVALSFSSVAHCLSAAH
jgi:hypothetical protein